jgi:hypothetical protein
MAVTRGGAGRQGLDWIGLDWIGLDLRVVTHLLAGRGVGS